ncbi:MAG: hypothetical protein A4S14_06010 [Proteobacteria bacterium SG_bin9]|jgi:hypothetical protein|nr:MAG: hypothetical protein A4S14_06010 [Proteobacteria bacterium SG_bin9]
MNSIPMEGLLPSTDLLANLSSERNLLDGTELKQTTYALDRESRKTALARFLSKAVGEPSGDAEQEPRRAA